MLYSSGALNYGQAKIVQDSEYEGIKITNITHVGWLCFLNLWVCEVLNNDLCTYRMTPNQNVQITSLSPIPILVKTKMCLEGETLNLVF